MNDGPTLSAGTVGADRIPGELGVHCRSLALVGTVAASVTSAGLVRQHAVGDVGQVDRLVAQRAATEESPSQEVVRPVFPGVADPPVDLEHGLGDLTGPRRHVGLGDPRRRQCVLGRQPVDGPGGVVGGAAGRFDAHVLVGGQVCNGLE